MLIIQQSKRHYMGCSSSLQITQPHDKQQLKPNPENQGQNTTIENLQATTLGVADMASLFQQESTTTNIYLNKWQSIVFQIVSPKISSFLADVLKNIKESPLMFGLLDATIFAEIQESVIKNYYSPSQKKDLAKNLLEYMRKCIDRQKEENQDYNDKFFKQFGENIFKIQNRAYFDNKSILKVMSYLCKSQNKYECYLDLKFDLNLEETISVAKKTRELYKQDSRAFFFLSFYLFRSSSNLQKQGYRLIDIEKTLNNAMQAIELKYPAAPPLPDSEELSHHGTKKMDAASVKFDILDLTKIKGENRKQAIRDFIFQRAQEAEASADKFASLVDKVCSEKGSHLKIGVKVKDRNHHRAIDRVIEKVIKNQFNKFTPSKFEQENEGKKKTLDQFIIEEKRRYQIQIEEIYCKIDEPIYFKVSDMLRGKCLFQTVQEINECAHQLMVAFKEKGFNLLELDNRLNTKTSDIVFKILVDKTIAELQLPIQFNIAQNQFSHKIFEIKRSNFHSPFTMLKIMNDQICGSFFDQILERLKVNNKFTDHNQQQKLYKYDYTYRSLEEQYKKFRKMVGIDKLKNEFYSQDFVELPQLNLFDKILQQSKTQAKQIKICSKISRNNGEYFQAFHKFLKSKDEYLKYLEGLNTAQLKSELIEKQREHVYRLLGDVIHNSGKSDEALKFYKLSLQTNKQKNKEQLSQYSKTLSKIANMYQFLGNYSESLDYYQKCLKIQKQLSGAQSLVAASILKGIANVEQQMGLYNDGLTHFSQCLAIQEKIKGKDSFQTSSTLRGMGLIYKKLKRYEEALRYYYLCYEIEDRVKGKGAFETSTTLRGLGNIYLDMKRYTQAFDNYSKCLEIKEKVKGVGSIDTAAIINNIAELYEKQGKYEQSLKYYSKCLEIKERIKGKGSIDTASTLRGIGIVYEKQGFYKEALDFFERSLKIKQAVKGKGNVDTAGAIQSIGNVFHDMKRYDEAISRYKQARAIYSSVFGENSKQVQQIDQSLKTTIQSRF